MVGGSGALVMRTASRGGRAKAALDIGDLETAFADADVFAGCGVALMLDWLNALYMSTGLAGGSAADASSSAFSTSRSGTWAPELVEIFLPAGAVGVNSTVTSTAGTAGLTTTPSTGDGRERFCGLPLERRDVVASAEAMLPDEA